MSSPPRARWSGVPFRLHGRDPASGLDCVGVAANAHGIVAVPTGYALRTASLGAMAKALCGAGFAPVETGHRPGDLLILRPGPGQLHLGVWTGESLIHAGAGLGRVVETPGNVDAIVAIWRKC